MLVQLLEKEAVPFETLHGRYGALLQLVKKLIGVVPECDRYLEIWPTAFRKALQRDGPELSQPAGDAVRQRGAPRPASLGLAMYVASRTAGCPYCSAHTCSFALRRGATVDQVAAALDGDAKLGAAERAAVAVARGLASVPMSITDDDRAALRRELGPANAEWIVLGIAMMGWLNKMMDALGVPLEPSTAAEVERVIAPSGWRSATVVAAPTPPPSADSLGTKLGVIRYAPAAVGFDRRATRGVPRARWPPHRGQVPRGRRRATTSRGWIGKLAHRRAVRAIAMMIRDNLADTVIGKAEKLAAGLVYAEVVADPALAETMRSLGAKPVADSPVQRLARAIAPSPAVVDADIVASSKDIPPAGIVELVAFVSLAQMLHRLDGYFA